MSYRVSFRLEWEMPDGTELVKTFGGSEEYSVIDFMQTLMWKGDGVRWIKAVRCRKDPDRLPETYSETVEREAIRLGEMNDYYPDGPWHPIASKEYETIIRYLCDGNDGWVRRAGRDDMKEWEERRYKYVPRKKPIPLEEYLKSKEGLLVREYMASKDAEYEDRYGIDSLWIDLFM